ncbi:MAG: adenylosuccinate lyase [Mollicutes bacterium]|nr:adenylosuccinate lyase [Mollicutes bacterium]MDY6070180.1 adenylosuccinate lyase [Bacilli bacterium]
MIERYAPKKIETLFTDESRFDAYLEIEIAVVEGWNKLGLVPDCDLKAIQEKAKTNVTRIKELEQITKHDVVAFTRQISETLGEERKWIHYGLTSTDVVDSALGLLYKKADDLILKDYLAFMETLKEKALEYEFQPCIARTHGMHAEVYSFGLKFASFYDEAKRSLKLFEEARKQIECVKLSGAVGTYANIDPRVEEYVAKKLGLSKPSIATQVLSRDRHEEYASAITIASSLIEKIAVEIRNLSRTEIGELEEGFSKGQKGSSAMPQKRNPISSENLTGAARMMRGYLLPILEDNALYHERDISHSIVERVSFIDMIELFDYMLMRMTRVVENLSIFPRRMEENIQKTHGAIYSQRAMNALIEKGLSREKAYDLVQPLAMNSVTKGMEFIPQLLENQEILKYLAPDEITSLTSVEYYFKNIDYIYKEIGLK